MNKTPSFKQLLKHPVHFLAFGFGSGLAKKAPGTFGTLAAIPMYYILVQYLPNWYLELMLVVIVTGVWLCGKTAKDIGVHDHGGIVWDEIAGFLLTLYWVTFSWQNVLLGFVLFRFFDIVKPWPIGWLDRKVDGGLGIMVDDLVAGLMAAACLQLIVQFV
ncbi:MAG: phosphatidylglycerophosphatase A [Cycloclasticus sp.]|nr:phosphatidylglycerophosphatase A [Gammaproteobacteria bacterium]MBQ0790221.1 phosphatidylglycerophosphatase A [Cycloclasticus sp.]